MTVITSVTGNISTPTEVDSYALNLEAGAHYSFDITGQTARNSSYTLGNPVIKIYAPDGTMVAQQDYSTISTGMGDGAGLLSLDPHFAFTAGASGQYTVTVSSGEIAALAYDWDTYLPNSGQTLDNLNHTGTYQLAVNSYSNTQLVDPVIGNFRWMDHSGDARGTGTTIYYDFATNNLGSSTTTATNPAYGWHNIQDFNVADQAKIEGWLSEFEAVANINFVRADANHPATMNFMQGNAVDGSTGTAWLYDKQGNQFNAGDYSTDRQLGRVDLLIDTDIWSTDGITSGSGYATFMHEMGHALGLKHPGNYFGESITRVENAAYDNTAWSLLSYNDNWQQGWQTEGKALKPLDIAALQTLYGKSASYLPGDTVWHFNDTQAEYGSTIYDTGGIDTIDASGQNIGAEINLQPGSLSSIGGVSVPTGMEAELAQYTVAGVFGDKAYNNVGISLDTLIENALGGSGSDHITGNSLNNVITGNGGNDSIDGGTGTDTAVFTGQYSQYQISQSNGHLSITDTVSNRDGTDTLTNIDHVQFADQTLGIDALIQNISGGHSSDTFSGNALNNVITSNSSNNVIDGVAGFDTAVFAGQYNQYHVSESNGQLSVADTVSNRDGTDTLSNIDRVQFSDKTIGLDTGAGQSTGEVYRLYLTVLGRNPEADAVGCGFWIDKLDNNVLNTEQMVSNFLDSSEFVSRFGTSTSSSDSFVNLMYQNLLGRDGHPDSGFNFWVGVLDNQLASRAQVVASFMESPENVANSAPLIGDAPTFQQWLG